MRDLRGLPIKELRQIVVDEYLDRYFLNRDVDSLFAEGSVSYFYAPERLEPALRLWPRSKFIISLRNPLHMIPSLHQRLFYNGDESERQFERAWSLVPERRNGRSIPRGCLDPRFLDYWEAGQLGKYLARFLEVIGRERCLVSVFDDFTADPGREYRRILDFLGLEDDHRSVFDRNAESQDCRIAWLHHFLQRPPRAALWLFDREDLLVKFQGGADQGGKVIDAVMKVRDRILTWNRVPAVPPQIDSALLAEMRSMYSDDVTQLSELMDRDLTHWLDC
jgi:hypothetical protein